MPGIEKETVLEEVEVAKEKKMGKQDQRKRTHFSVIFKKKVVV